MKWSTSQKQKNKTKKINSSRVKTENGQPTQKETIVRTLRVNVT